MMKKMLKWIKRNWPLFRCFMGTCDKPILYKGKLKVGEKLEIGEKRNHEPVKLQELYYLCPNCKNWTLRWKIVNEWVLQGKYSW